MSDDKLLEILREEFSKHTRLKLVIETVAITEFGEFVICGFDRDNCVLRIMIIEDSLAIRTKLYSSSSDTIKIPLCDPEMFNRAIAVIKNLENAENNSKRIDDQHDE